MKMAVFLLLVEGALHTYWDPAKLAIDIRLNDPTEYKIYHLMEGLTPTYYPITYQELRAMVA